MERREGAVSPFGTLENRNQWSATYRRIFDSFPQYDFLRSFQRSELPDRFQPQNGGAASQYATIRKTPSPNLLSHSRPPSQLRNQETSPEISPRSILRKTPSPAPSYHSPVTDNGYHRRDSNDTTTLSLPRKISYDTSEISPPLSILRRDSHDSSIRGKKRVSICEERNIVSDGREAALRKIMENDVSCNIRNAIQREFKANDDVNCEILCDTHLPESHSLDRTGKLSSNDKKVYFNLQQNLILGNSREELRQQCRMPPRESNGINFPVKDTLICQDLPRYHSPPRMENAGRPREFPRTVYPTEVHQEPAGFPSQKKPVCRLDSNTTSVSTTSATTSVMSELNRVQNLLQIQRNGAHQGMAATESLKGLDCESPIMHTKSTSWLRRKLDWDPMEPELISIVRQKVETGRPLDWADLFILKTFHLSTVQPMETELFKLLLLETDHPRDIEELRQTLNEEYAAYQRILHNCCTHPSVYTSLAHSICLADSFWFHARIIEDDDERSRLYRRAIDTYSNLLDRAERTLSPEDVSLIRIIEKISAILAESRNFDADLILRASLLIDKAERRLDIGRETESRRRVERCKKNLAEINSHCHVPV